MQDAVALGIDLSDAQLAALLAALEARDGLHIDRCESITVEQLSAMHREDVVRLVRILSGFQDRFVSFIGEATRRLVTENLTTADRKILQSVSVTCFDAAVKTAMEIALANRVLH